MNREDIIRMARECGWSKEYLEIGDERLERFATLVASAERERLIDASMKAAEKAVDVAIALEREACSKVCYEHCGWTPRMIGETIRARGKA
jgi:hypothetical protein